MARILTVTAPDYIRSDSSPMTSLPITISCWVRIASAPGAIQTVLYYADSSSATIYFQFAMLTTGAFRVYPRWTLTAGTITSGTGFADDQWHHLMYRTWVNGSTYEHEFWVDGVSVGSFGTGNAGTIANFDRVTVGYLDRPSPMQPLDGTVAEVAIVSMRGEINHAVALARGVNPRRVFGTNLKFYAPLWGLDFPEPELSGSGNDLTLFGSPSQANHAPVAPYTPNGSASFPLIETGGAATRRIYLDDALISIPA